MVVLGITELRSECKLNSAEKEVFRRVVKWIPGFSWRALMSLGGNSASPVHLAIVVKSVISRSMRIVSRLVILRLSEG
jgi:hypothetical protein